MKKAIAILLLTATLASSLLLFSSCGEDPKDGLTPLIGENENWRLGDTDTEISARGPQGDDGDDGQSISIGENGNWWLGDTDTGISARGPQGDDGDDGQTISIGKNGNRWIGDTDTGISARGPQGEKGEDGEPGTDGANGTNGANGQDAQNPIFRYNVATACLEVSYDDGVSWLEMPKYPFTEELIGPYEFPMASITILDGTIENISNKFITNKDYRGAVIPLTDLDYDTVTITPSQNTEEFGYTFLNDLPVVKEVPHYSEGYSEVVWPGSGEPVVLTIPSDAEYLYVYYKSENVIYLPKSIVFSNTLK